MAKILAWLILIFVVLLALRLVNRGKARRDAARPAGGTGVEPMVRCVRCGVFLPRADATSHAGGFACPDGQCVKR